VPRVLREDKVVGGEHEWEECLMVRWVDERFGGGAEGVILGEGGTGFSFNFFDD